MYTQAQPCRCGFDGTGIHRCHAGRELGDTIQCTEPAQEILVPYMTCLAGVQMKLGIKLAYYCIAHRKEAGFESAP